MRLHPAGPLPVARTCPHLVPRHRTGLGAARRSSSSRSSGRLCVYCRVHCAAAAVLRRGGFNVLCGHVPEAAQRRPAHTHRRLRCGRSDEGGAHAAHDTREKAPAGQRYFRGHWQPDAGGGDGRGGRQHRQHPHGQGPRASGCARAASDAAAHRCSRRRSPSAPAPPHPRPRPHRRRSRGNSGCICSRSEANPAGSCHNPRSHYYSCRRCRGRGEPRQCRWPSASRPPARTLPPLAVSVSVSAFLIAIAAPAASSSRRSAQRRQQQQCRSSVIRCGSAPAHSIRRRCNGHVAALAGGSSFSVWPIRCLIPERARAADTAAPPTSAAAAAVRGRSSSGSSERVGRPLCL